MANTRNSNNDAWVCKQSKQYRNIIYCDLGLLLLTATKIKTIKNIFNIWNK